MAGEWIAAGASIAGASVAAFAAWRANRSADGIDRRRHMIEAHDREIASLESAYANMMGVWGKAKHQDDLSAVAFAAEVVRSHSLCTPQLDHAIANGVVALFRRDSAGGQARPKLNVVMGEIREEAATIASSAKSRREAIASTLRAK